MTNGDAQHVQTLIEFVLGKTRRTSLSGKAPSVPSSAEARQSAMLLADQASKTGCVAIFGEFVGTYWPKPGAFVRCGAKAVRKKKQRN